MVETAEWQSRAFLLTDCLVPGGPINKHVALHIKPKVDLYLVNMKQNTKLAVAWLRKDTRSDICQYLMKVFNTY